MKYDNIRYNLVNTINEVIKEIYSLDEFSQEQIHVLLTIFVKYILILYSRLKFFLCLKKFLV